MRLLAPLKTRGVVDNANPGVNRNGLADVVAGHVAKGDGGEP